MLIGGKASKRSKFGATSGEKLTRTIWAAKLCEKAGLRYHVIDSELKMNYLMGHEVKKVIEPEQNVVTVLTFASRHINSIRIMRQSLRSVPGTDRLAVCAVAGNRAFLDWRELRRPVRRSLVDFLKWLRGRHPDIQTFVGTEGFYPPEGPGSPAGDIYSLGKVFYEAVTGFNRQKFPDLPSGIGTMEGADRFNLFNRIILKACESNVRKRYSTAREMYEDLRRFAEKRSPVRNFFKKRPSPNVKRQTT